MKILIFFILLNGAFLSDQEIFNIKEQNANEVQLSEYTSISFNPDTLALWLPDSVFNIIQNNSHEFKAARLSIKNDGPNHLKYVLKTGGRDKVYAFFESENVSYTDTSGWLSTNYYRRLNSEKHYENRFFIKLKPRENLQVTLLYHITRGRGPEANVSIMPYQEYLLQMNQRKAKGNYQQGIFQGLVGILFIINFFYFFLTRDSAYLAYSLYNLFIWAYTSSLYGYLYLSFLDYDPILKYLADNVFLLFSILFYFMFLRKFINTRERFPFWHKITDYLTSAVYTLIVLTSILIYFYQAAYLPYDIRNITILFCLVLATVFIIHLLISGDLKDRLFATGTSTLIIFAFISIATYFMRDNINSDKILQIGIVLELSIFSVALAVRTRGFEKDKVEAQVALIDQLNENEKLKNQFIERLEQEVQIRTDEISTQNEELIQQKEELMAQREMLEHQKRVIEANFEELSEARNFLETKVNERTEELARSNSELVQQNSQLEQYAFITAHNLRAPVARLLGLTDLFDRLSGKDSASREISEHVRKAAKDMEEVITDLNKILEIRKHENVTKKRIYYDELFSKIFSRLENMVKEADPEIDLHIKAESITTFPAYIESIFYNLISNSLKYRSEDRRLKLQISIKNNEKGHHIKIADNGLGIDLKSNKKKIFGLYQRFHDHVDGKGLGLYLIKTQIEALNGDIKLSSEPDKGTTFEFHIPDSKSTN